MDVPSGFVVVPELIRVITVVESWVEIAFYISVVHKDLQVWLNVCVHGESSIFFEKPHFLDEINEVKKIHEL